MKKRRGLALLLAVSMLVATAGEAYAADVGTTQTNETIVITEAHDSDTEDIQEENGDDVSTEESTVTIIDTEAMYNTDGVFDAGETDSEFYESYVDGSSESGIMTVAETGWMPTPTKTVSSASEFPVTLKDGDVLQINGTDGTLEYTAPTGKSPIEVAGGSVTIIINGDVSLHGADASGTTGATAAIHVVNGSTPKVTILSAHDEELAQSTEAPKDTLTISGGNAANGEDGHDGVRTELWSYNGNRGHGYTWTAGRGGNGGGGAAAAIGGNGGNGGTSSENVATGPTWFNFMTGGDGSVGQSTGTTGDSGVRGASGESCGHIFLSGRLNINATGGSAGIGGTGGTGSEGYSYAGENRSAIGGAGGGGGGGGGCAAPAFGAGGAGGSSGGNGGQGGYDSNGNFIGLGTNTQGPGGGGGAGGWPNGGGGGGGAGTCSKAEKDGGTPGDGGVGGAEGAAGMAGNSGTSTHIETQGGEPGAGANGISSSYDASNCAVGGTGGIENDNKFNGGAGGNGGGPVQSTYWYIQGRMLVSTAVNLNTQSWGNGGGEAQLASKNPAQLVDAMDCEFTLEYTSTVYWLGRSARPQVKTCTYNASTDRDGKIAVNEATRDMTRTNYVNYPAYVSYGKNVNCPTGTLTIGGAANSYRVNQIDNNNDSESVYSLFWVGEKPMTFEIRKGTIYKTDIKADKTTAIVGQSVGISLNWIYYENGSAYLKNVNKTVTWEVAQGQGELTGNGLNATFTPTSSGEIKIQAKLTDMANYNDYVAEVTFTSIGQPLQATIMPETPHVHKTVKVVLPQEMSEDKCTFQWYLSGQLIEGATEITYTPTVDDIGKLLSVKVESTDTSVFFNETVMAKYVVANHTTFTQEGFCETCGWYQPATLNGDTYEIGNVGQLLWMAAFVNGDSTRADFTGTYTSSKCVLTADIDMGLNQWTPMSLYKGEFDGQNHSIKNIYIESSDESLGFIEKAPGAQLKNLVLNGEINATEGNKYVGGLVGYIDSGSVSNVTADFVINNASSTNVNTGGVVGYSKASLSNVTSKAVITNDGTVSNAMGGVAGYSGSGSVSNIQSSAILTNNGTVEKGMGGFFGYVENCTLTEAHYNEELTNNGTINQGMGGIAGSMSSVTLKSSTSGAKLNNNQTCNYGLGGMAGWVNACTFNDVTSSASIVNAGTSSKGAGGVFGYGMGSISGNTITSRATILNKGTMSDGVGGIAGYVEKVDRTRGNISFTNFTVGGRIYAQGNASFAEGTGIGGVAGYAYRCTLKNGTSSVTMSPLKTVRYGVAGGLVGISKDKVQIDTCIFNGSIDIGGTTASAGGLVGSSYATENEGVALVANSANYGKVFCQGEYVGGIVGFMKSYMMIVSCYNYGSLTGGADYVGGLIGYAHNPMRGTGNNCYLNTSAKQAIGGISGSADTSTWCVAKTKQQFANGEVCSIVAQQARSGYTPVWRQDIDNGQTPYDSYPVFEGGVVYALSDGTYSNSPEKISVEISWGTMAFKYEPGEWSAEDHSYSGGWTPTTTDANLISVKNDSNVTLAVNASFEASEALAPYELTGTFEGMTSGKKNVTKGTTLQTRLLLNSLKPDSLEDQGSQSLGQVTVSLTTLKGGGN